MAKTAGISEIGIEKQRVTIIGRDDSRLVVHNFGEKPKQEIRDKQAKKPKKAKEERNPNAEFLANRYVDEDGNECVPITAIKKAIVTAATAFEDLTKTGLRQAIFVTNPDKPGAMLLPIKTPDGKPAVGVMREDAVTIGMNIRGLAYRPEYAQWKVTVDIEYNSRIVSRDQLLALVEQAGWGVGICEGRPEKTSALGWGRFTVKPE